MNRILLSLSVLCAVSTAYAEREVFAPSTLAPTVTAGTVQFGDGTAAAPSITFSADPDTGLWRRGTNALAIALNGQTQIAFSGNRQLFIGDTSAAVPTEGRIFAESGSGTNIGGAPLNIYGGNSTGNAQGGSIGFYTANSGGAGSGANTLTERMRLGATGVLVMASGSYIDAGVGKFELPNGTAIPATCTVGELFQDTDSNDCINTAGGDGALCICKTTNTWALISNF